MRRPLTPEWSPLRHDGRQGGDRGPIRPGPLACPPIDERQVELSIRRLRQRVAAGEVGK